MSSTMRVLQLTAALVGLAAGVSVAGPPSTEGPGVRPEPMIAGVDIRQLGQALGMNLSRVALGAEGAYLEGTRPGTRCHVGIAVLASVEEAAPTWCRDRFGNTLPPPDRESDTADGPGDARWLASDGGGMWFRRQNVLCHVYIGPRQREQEMALAGRIDRALRDSAEVAPRAQVVEVPRIETVLLDPPRLGTRVRVRFDVVDGPPVLWWTEDRMSDGPVTSGVREFRCSVPGEYTARFWLVTEMNVVANSTFTFTVPEPEDAREGR